VSGSVTGIGALQKTGNGLLILGGSNSYTGGTIISGGTLQTANPNALGSPGGNLAVNAGTLDLDGKSINVGALSGSSGSVITTTAAGTITLTSSAAGSTTYAGSITAGSGQLGLTQAGAGTLKLTGNNTYTGPTGVNAGTLIVSGSLSGTGSASVALGATLEVDGLLNHSASTTLNGGTLQGTGSVGAITDNGGSIVAPGLVAGSSQSGTLTAAGAVSLAATTNFNIRIGTKSGGTDSDQLVESGGAPIALSGTLNLTLGSYAGQLTPASINNLYYVIVNGGTSQPTGDFANVPNDGNTITLSGFTFAIYYDVNAGNTSSGNDVVLELTAIPEPGTWATMLSGFGMLLFVQRMRRKMRQ
jgi:autotransporter-associated beta strand protein